MFSGLTIADVDRAADEAAREAVVIREAAVLADETRAAAAGDAIHAAEAVAGIRGAAVESEIHAVAVRVAPAAVRAAAPCLATGSPAPSRASAPWPRRSPPVPLHCPHPAPRRSRPETTPPPVRAGNPVHELSSLSLRLHEKTLRSETISFFGICIVFVFI